LTSCLHSSYDTPNVKTSSLGHSLGLVSAGLGFFGFRRGAGGAPARLLGVLRAGRRGRSR